MATTRKKVKVIGTETYIKQDTGEIAEMQVVKIEERDANFHKLWLGHILQSIDLIGNQKLNLRFGYWTTWIAIISLSWHKENRWKIGMSTKTVSTTIKALVESNFLNKINSGAYRVNPDVLFKGGKDNRLNVLFYSTEMKKQLIILLIVFHFEDGSRNLKGCHFVFLLE